MKKRLLALLFSMLFLLSACGGKGEKPKAPDALPQPSVENEAPALPLAPETPDAPQGDINPLTGLCDAIKPQALGRKPVALMVSNSRDSLPQWGINQADIIYEMLAEGRITRFMAIFQDPSKIDKLASIRSARPYFIDIAQSYGAIYMHFGGSVPAYEAFAQRAEVIHLDGIGAWEGTLYFRDPQRRKLLGKEHSVYTTGEYIESALASLKPSLELGGAPSAFAFSTEHSAKIGHAMTRVDLEFGPKHKPYFTYDTASGEYLRFQYGDPHMDGLTKRQLSFKNLFVLEMEATAVPNNDLHLMDIKTTGKGGGYYFCDGKYIPITWLKDSYSSPILFFDESGSPLSVCPGQSFVSVVPKGSAITIS